MSVLLVAVLGSLLYRRAPRGGATVVVMSERPSTAAQRRTSKRSPPSIVLERSACDGSGRFACLSAQHKVTF